MATQLTITPNSWRQREEPAPRNPRLAAPQEVHRSGMAVEGSFGGAFVPEGGRSKGEGDGRGRCAMCRRWRCPRWKGKLAASEVRRRPWPTEPTWPTEQTWPWPTEPGVDGHSHRFFSFLPCSFLFFTFPSASLSFLCYVSAPWLHGCSCFS